MNRGNIYASTADVLARANVEDAMKSARNLATKLPTQDMLGIFAFFVLLPLGFLYTVTFPLPIWFDIYSRAWLLRVIPLGLLGLNVYLNAWKMCRVGSNSADGLLLPSVQKPGFRYCHDCQMNAPPRAFHCPVCNFCVLRRDHHCSFVGHCVGHFNQRYFMAAVVNLWPIALMCFIWNTAQMLLVFDRFHPLDFWKWMFPHLALITGFISLYQFAMIFAFASSFCLFCFTSYLVGAQLFCLWRGQTRVEYLMDIRAYDLGFWENLNQSLGRHWLLAMLSPFASSPLQSDGLSFRTRDREQIGKTTKYF